MLRPSGSLRAAARQLGMLPEVVEASRLRASGDFAGALRQAERAAEVVAGVPMPALQVVAGGALAQLLRASGQPAREIVAWQNVLTKCGDGDEPSMRLHCIHGAASCQLYLGNAKTVLQSCEEAVPLIAAQQGPAAVEWNATFGTHRAVASLLALRLDGCNGSSSGNSDGSSDRGVSAISSWLEERLEEAAAARSVADAATGDEALQAASAAVQLADAGVEGTRLVLGDAHTHAGDMDAARACWEASLPDEGQGGSEGGDDATGGAAGTADTASVPLAASARARAMREVAARLRLGSSLLATREVSAAREQLTRALTCCETHLEPEHPLLPFAVGQLAAAVAAEGEFMSAEGLYRSAISSLDVQGNEPLPASHLPLLLPSLEAFARLLERLETNGKPRTAEAEQMRARAAEIWAECSHALPPEQVSRGTGWLGLEPWHAAAGEVDWLGSCLADE